MMLSVSVDGNEVVVVLLHRCWLVVPASDDRTVMNSSDERRLSISEIMSGITNLHIMAS